MTAATLPPPPANAPATALTTRDLLDRVGDVPLSRVCFDPPPGTATEQDALALRDRTKRLYELVDGVVVEKAMGFPQSCLAAMFVYYLQSWVVPRGLGVISTADGLLRLRPGLVRIPDVSFVPWSRIPGRCLDQTDLVPSLYPELAVEVLSPSNTPGEMRQKRQEYFAAGCRLVWVVDPAARTVEAFTGPTTSTLLTAADTLTGDPVLPGISLPLADLFGHLDPH